ncbi:MAG TPA: DUF397 domain-containing protein [Actinophytocola sp.]|uniref:DUF397 domain-containing protein n=1 Tax=Actinophytocola sp. TaxID=1872138 RepID=UPI002DB5B308|nr:DUF397 domain-containing protein [Actinophytocola sp.]HEU5472843.1 DUF397 domain-containing protein [Actinophytocola sp.]
MHGEPLRFKKSSRSGGESNCVEIAHTYRLVRDTKNPGGPVLDRVDARRLIDFARWSGQGCTP